MADDLTKKGQADRIRINVNAPHELRYWSKDLGVSKERLRELVKRHGVMASEIREALSK